MPLGHTKNIQKLKDQHIQYLLIKKDIILEMPASGFFKINSAFIKDFLSVPLQRAAWKWKTKGSKFREKKKNNTKCYFLKQHLF